MPPAQPGKPRQPRARRPREEAEHAAHPPVAAAAPALPAVRRARGTRARGRCSASDPWRSRVLLTQPSLKVPGKRPPRDLGDETRRSWFRFLDPELQRGFPPSSPGWRFRVAAGGLRPGGGAAAPLRRGETVSSLSDPWRGSKNVGSEVQGLEELGGRNQLELGH